MKISKNGLVLTLITMLMMSSGVHLTRLPLMILLQKRKEINTSKPTIKTSNKSPYMGRYKQKEATGICILEGILNAT